MHILLTTILLSVMLTCGCELFSTREPESPTGLSSSGWQFPRNPRTVLENLSNAIGRRSSVDYLHTFSSAVTEQGGFRFIPDPKTVNNHQGHFDGWDIERERKWAEALFNPGVLPSDSISSFSFDVDFEIVLGDSADISAIYNLHLGISDVLEFAPRRMEGRIDFKLRRGVDGEWLVTRWMDFRTTGEPCWSDLKAFF